MLHDDFNVRKKGRELIFIAKKIYSYFYHTAFLESCYVYNIVPRGLYYVFAKFLRTSFL